MKTMEQIDAEYKAEMNRARWEGVREIVILQLNRRVGNLPTDVQVRIQSLSEVRLQELSEALLDFTSLADLEVWLNHD
jgi:Domain of unknown function (DUF4351)